MKQRELIDRFEKIFNTSIAKSTMSDILSNKYNKSLNDSVISDKACQNISRNSSSCSSSHTKSFSNGGNA